MEQMIRTEEALRIKIGKKLWTKLNESVIKQWLKHQLTDKYSSSAENWMKIKSKSHAKLKQWQTILVSQSLLVKPSNFI